MTYLEWVDQPNAMVEQVVRAVIPNEEQEIWLWKAAGMTMGRPLDKADVSYLIERVTTVQDLGTVTEDEAGEMMDALDMALL